MVSKSAEADIRRHKPPSVALYLKGLPGLCRRIQKLGIEMLSKAVQAKIFDRKIQFGHGLFERRWCTEGRDESGSMVESC